MIATGLVVGMLLSRLTARLLTGFLYEVAPQTSGPMPVCCSAYP
jgi:hypothetical protein